MRAVLQVGPLEGFRYWLEAKSLVRLTVRNYTNHARYWVTWCRDHEIDFAQAERDQITFYLGDRAKQHLATTVQLDLLSVRYFYDYLVEDAVCPVNPARQVRYRKPKARDVIPFSEDELRRMYSACDSFREQAMIMLLVGAGLRRSEVFRVRREHACFDTGALTVLGKGSKYRTLYPGTSIMDGLEMALRFDEDLCPFTADDFVQRTVQRIAKRARIHGRVHPHRFRHTFATMFLDAGGSVEALQIILGHARLDQSLFYAKAGREKRAQESLGRIDLARRLLGH